MTPEQEAVLNNIKQRRQVLKTDRTQRPGYQRETDILRQIQERRNKRSDEAGALEAIQQAGESFVPSLKKVGSSMAYMFNHPSEAWEGMKALGSDIADMNPVFRGDALDAETPALDAAGEYFSKYGSAKGIKRAFTQDPAGMLMDAAIPLSGTSAILSKAPGIAGKVGQTAGKVAGAIDPINVGIKGGKLAGDLMGKTAGAAGRYFSGYTTGAGERAVGEAYKSGRAQSPAFRQAMRGEEDLEDILHDVEANVDIMQKAKSQSYKQGIGSTHADQTRLRFDSINAKMRELEDSLTYKGKSMYDESELVRVREMMDIIEDWKNSPEVHDAGGFDALKRRLDRVNINPKDHSNAYRIKSDLRNTVKKAIVDQVPEYADVMRDYEKATKELNDIRKTLAFNPNATVNQQINKLRRLMERGVTEGKEKLLGKIDLPGTSISERLAGIQMKDPFAKGLIRYAGPSSLGVGSATAGSAWPLVLGLPMQSPRLVGEVAHGLGRGVTMAEQLASKIPLHPRPVGHGFFQGGRLTEELQNRR